MKKLYILLLLIILTSCNQIIITNIYERKYDTEKDALADIFFQVNKYELDSIPLRDWITSKVGNDSITIEQRSIRKLNGDKSEYDFIYTKYTHLNIKCICPEREDYHFIIRYKGEKK